MSLCCTNIQRYCSEQAFMKIPSYLFHWKKCHNDVIYFVLCRFNPMTVLAFGYCHRLRLCGSVCPCVCVNHELVRTITHRSFKLGSPHLDQRCKTPCVRSLLFLGMIDLDLQGQIKLKCQSLLHFELVRNITHQPFLLESPNLDQNASQHCLDPYKFWIWLVFDLHSHFQSWNLFFYQIHLRSFCIIFSVTRRL